MSKIVFIAVAVTAIAESAAGHMAIVFGHLGRHSKLRLPFAFTPHIDYQQSVRGLAMSECYIPFALRRSGRAYPSR